LYTFYEQQQLWHALLEQAKRGIKIRILMMASDNPALLYAVSNREPVSDQIKATSKKFLDDIKIQLHPPTKDNIEIRLVKDKVLFISIRRFDSQMYVVPYLYSKNTPETPIAVVEGTEKPLFKTWTGEFNQLWHDAHVLQ
jgi:hypothetical protein